MIYVYRVTDGTRRGLHFIEANSKMQADHRVSHDIVQFVGTLEEFVAGLEEGDIERNVFLAPNSSKAVGWRLWN